MMKSYTTQKQVKAAQIQEVIELEDDHFLAFDEQGEDGVLLSSLGNASAGVPAVGDYVIDYTREDGSNKYWGWCLAEEFEKSATLQERPLTDEDMEQEIVELGLTAPRVTLDHIKSLMARVTYAVNVVEGTTTTHAVAMLEGFTLAIGQSACVDPANFNAELGRKYAIEEAKKKAQDKLWELEGYRLKFGRISDDGVKQVARVAHEINRAYCLAIGDESQPAWKDAPSWQKQSAISGVCFHIANPDASPSASHDNWLQEKLADGWVYGEVKDPDAKTHPCCVPYEQLPVEQKAKDYLFKQVIASLVK